MEILTGVLILAVFGLAFWGAAYLFIKLVRALFRNPSQDSSMAAHDNNDDNIDGMNNGDYYNGPHGYSPITGYPETQYGSGFDPGAEWNHEEND